MSLKTVLNGEYTDSLNDWLADHFPQRDFFVGLKSSVEIACGRKYINHVYVAKEDYFIEPYKQPQNTERIGKEIFGTIDGWDSGSVIDGVCRFHLIGGWGVGMDTGKVTDSLYNLDYLEEKDKYSLFLDNIHPLIIIENAAADSQDGWRMPFPSDWRMGRRQGACHDIW